MAVTRTFALVLGLSMIGSIVGSGGSSSIGSALGSVAAARSPRRLSVNVSGTYSSNWDDVSLVQIGTRVRGTYVCCGGGTIEGFIVEGSVIRFTWREPRGAGQGEGIWRIAKDGRLEGTWGLGQNNVDGGPWTLVPKRADDEIAQ